MYVIARLEHNMLHRERLEIRQNRRAGRANVRGAPTALFAVES